MEADENELDLHQQVAGGGRTTSLVFISHDSRDAVIAEAFSNLLGAVSAGVLKSFRSSDRTGHQGIQYGSEWYTEVMRKLNLATDVVCLLTRSSIGRPWILYEAGVAKGQVKTPVHGLAIGIDLSQASVGPFAQFQNCDDSVESIASLVFQLVKRIPESEPSREIIMTQVEIFKEKIEAVVNRPGELEGMVSESDEYSVAQLFEEIKVMHENLPAKVRLAMSESCVDGSLLRREVQPMLMDELVHLSDTGSSAFLGLLAFMGVLRNEMPVFYDVGLRAYFAEQEGNNELLEKYLFALREACNIFRRSSLLNDVYCSNDARFFLRDIPRVIDRFLAEATRRGQSEKSRNDA